MNLSSKNIFKSVVKFAAFKEKVISFVEFLRNNGFEADMDIKLMQEETAIDFNRLMHKGILKYDKVLIVLSDNYKTKAEAFEGGVGKEYRFIINDIEKGYIHFDNTVHKLDKTTFKQNKKEHKKTIKSNHKKSKARKKANKKKVRQSKRN